ncbi:cupredoxin family copper-binding protein [Mucilaginibacter litoreus]|uniref:Cupredoxin family copper-binding protein n=1 Tax=Mucilaginibacter litoreus TaxID=1048221 RepID=A0ABW3ANJ1_9SPHI
MKKYFLGISLIIAIVVITFAACSKSGSDSPEPQKPDNPGNTAGGDATVEIKNFAFSPATVTIKAGKSVTWTNADSAPHTATDDGGAFDSGSLATSATYKHAFTTAGTYTYHCTFHSNMVNAKVVVTN